MTLYIQLILAHLLGDFLLQSRRWVARKEQLKWRTPELYLHTGIHFLLVLLVTADLDLWPAALWIAASHWLIDGVKLQLQTERTRTAWFFADQLMHLLVIAGIWVWLVQPALSFGAAWGEEQWRILTGGLFLTVPASAIIRHLMNRWSDAIEQESRNDSLQDAGMYIGILERLFVFTLVLAGSWQTVGFLLAAKSVFRFGDLTRSRDRKLTEYILIGTLLSFGIGLGTAFLVM